MAEKNQEINSEPFIDFVGEYEKEFYDVKLPSGEIIEKCWANAGYLHRTDGNEGKWGAGECQFRKSIVNW